MTNKQLNQAVLTNGRIVKVGDTVELMPEAQRMEQSDIGKAFSYSHLVKFVGQDPRVIVGISEDEYGRGVMLHFKSDLVTDLVIIDGEKLVLAKEFV